MKGHLFQPSSWMLFKWKCCLIVRPFDWLFDGTFRLINSQTGYSAGRYQSDSHLKRNGLETQKLLLKGMSSVWRSRGKLAALNASKSLKVVYLWAILKISQPTVSHYVYMKNVLVVVHFDFISIFFETLTFSRSSNGYCCSRIHQFSVIIYPWT